MEAKKENVSITDRARFSMCGVTNIDAFDEDYVVLSVERGGVAVEGDTLKIISLSKENGEINITGNIKSITFYSENEAKRTRNKGIFK